MKEKLKKNLPLILAFVIPLVIEIGICIKHEVYPFGDACLLQVDMFHQYCPFFMEMMDKLKTGGSLFYSWRLGLGSDFLSLYAYYLASPLNWLLILWPKSSLIEFMSILVLLKIAFSGFTFAYYLREHFKTESLAVSVFGTAYALSGFMAAYSWDIMWLDCIALAPLIILGLERLIKEGKPRLYYITLALSILCNYYISILICIFLVIWFFITWLENKETGFLAWVRFAVYSLLAGGTGALLIIPEAIMLGYSGSQDISFPETMEWYFNLIDELSRHAIFTETHSGTEHWPNIYCGLFALILVILFALNKKIDKKKRLRYMLFALLFVLSFSNNMLDFIWHGFHFPDSLPGRQTFLYAFLLLVISYEAVRHLKENELWHFLVAGGINIVFWYAAYQRSDFAKTSERAFLITALFLAGYLCLTVVFKYCKPKIGVWFFWLGAVTALVELTLNFHVTGLDTVSRSSYVQRIDDYEMLLDYAEEKNEAEGGGFYRVEQYERKTKNDASLYGFPSVTLFSSMMNLDVSHFYQRVGMEGGKNYYCYNGETPLLSAFLSVKYILADNNREESPICTYLTEQNGSYLYENKYCLPLGFVMDESVVENWNPLDIEDKIAAQNELAYHLGASEEMLTQVSCVNMEGETSIQVPEDGYYFARYDSTDIDNLTMEITDGRTRDYAKVSHKYTLDLGYCYAGSTVWVRNSSGELLELSVYKLNLSALDTAYQTLNAQTMQLTDFSDTRVEGTVHIDQPGRLILTIANEEGWTLYVDGEKETPESFQDAFISVYLEEGDHEIRLKYHTPGLGTGAFLTVCCIGLFVWIEILKKNGIDPYEKTLRYFGLPLPSERVVKRVPNNAKKKKSKRKRK